MSATVIRKADWAVAWDRQAGRHVYRRGVDLAFSEGVISHLGEAYDGPVESEIDGTGLMVMPGLVNIHSHPLSEPLGKGFGDDVANPKLGMSGLYDYMPAYGPEPADMATCAEAAYAELLRSGVTMLVDLSVPYPGWLDTLERSGLRGVAAPMFRSARWYSIEGRAVGYEWAADGGQKMFEDALAIVDEAESHPSGRLSGMICPAQIDTCTPELFAAAKEEAKRRGLKLHTHASQSLWEFGEMTRRHGLSPIQWLESLALLDGDTIIAHAIFIDEHSWITWHTAKDLAILAESGAAVAHCPTVFVRHGMILESFSRYRRQGVTMGLGTDTYPHNFLEEMRLAAQLSRVADRHVAGADTAMILEGATTGGAAAIGREDIGRLEVGAKADLVLIDCEHPAMKPLRDPLRSLIFCAADRAVRDVYVDGRQVVAEGRVLGLEEERAAKRLDGVAEKAAAAVPDKDWAGRSADEMAPLTLPLA